MVCINKRLKSECTLQITPEMDFYSVMTHSLSCGQEKTLCALSDDPSPKIKLTKKDQSGWEYT